MKLSVLSLILAAPTVYAVNPEIKHIIVLMMENRSFDHMLGWQGRAEVDGLDGTEFNHIDSQDETSPKVGLADIPYS